MADPRYKLLQPFYCDDAYYEEDTEIEFDGIPNIGMLPLNALARAKFAEFRASLETEETVDEIVFRQMADRPRHLRAPRDRLHIPDTDETPPLTGVDNTGEIHRMTKDSPKAVKSSGLTGMSKPKKTFGGGVQEASA
jgi:hypothetical protein